VSDELDPTRAAERTLLAWNRSALALGVIAALALRLGVVRGTVIGYVVGGILLGLATATLVYGGAAYRASRRRMAAGEWVARPAVMRAAALATTVTGVGAFMLALLS
jgi:uncharacterized membrane protein YidH (DUF202 family)